MIPIGHVAKSHGLNGHFSIKLKLPNELCELCCHIKKIYLNTQQDPLLISNSKINNQIFLRVKISSINTREDAKKILQQTVYIKENENHIIDTELNKQNKFLNFTVFDKNEGKIGTIEEIDFNRMQPLFIIKQKQQKVLVPFVKEFIIDVNHNKKIITVNLPENLIKICNQ
mgnify:CR=1 FL=1